MQRTNQRAAPTTAIRMQRTNQRAAPTTAMRMQRTFQRAATGTAMRMQRTFQRAAPTTAMRMQRTFQRAATGTTTERAKRAEWGSRLRLLGCPVSLLSVELLGWGVGIFPCLSLFPWRVGTISEISVGFLWLFGASVRVGSFSLLGLAER